MRVLAALVGMSALLLADDGTSQKVRISHTERMDLPSGGLLQFKNSVGELTVEGWDRPDVEITTIKSMPPEYPPQNRQKATSELGRVQVSVERQGSDLIIGTTYPRHWYRPRGFDLWYQVKAPRNARLSVSHGSGEVHIDNLTSDIHVTVHDGGMTLRLPQNGLYDIDAKCDIGDVTSDFQGRDKRKPWLFGHQFLKEEQAGHSLYLRVGFGDITILGIRKPASPPPMAQ